MKDDSDKKAAALRLIERQFGKFRIENPGKKIGYPENLKTLINSNEVRSLTSLEIAKAAKISPKSVNNWRGPSTRKIKRLKPKELRLIADRSERGQSIIGSWDMHRNVRITLGNGVVIELGASELSTGLLGTLCGLGGINVD